MPILVTLKALARGYLALSTKKEAAESARARYAVLDEQRDENGITQLVSLHDFSTGVEAVVDPAAGGQLRSLVGRWQHLPIELLSRAAGIATPMAILGPIADRAFSTDLPWREVARFSDAHGARLAVELCDSPETRIGFPLAFSLRVDYHLVNGQLTISYTVEVPSGDAGLKPWAISHRMFFRLPFLDGTDAGDMRFRAVSCMQPHSAERPLWSREQYTWPFAEATRVGDFDCTGGLALEGMHNTPSVMLTDPKGLALRISHHLPVEPAAPAVQFQVQGGPREGYLCIAPVFGCTGAQAQWSLQLQPIEALSL